MEIIKTKSKELELFSRKEMMGGMKVRRSLDGNLIDAYIEELRLMPSETLRRLMSHYKVTALKDIGEDPELSDADKLDAAEAVEWFFTSYEKIFRNGYFLELKEKGEGGGGIVEISKERRKKEKLFKEKFE